MSPLLEIADLSIAAGEFALVAGVSATLDAGATLGVVGRSGSGKTTTALAVLGHLREGTRHTGGQVILDGHAMLPAPSN